MKPTSPMAFPGDQVMVENYKCRTNPKPIEKGRVLKTRTKWLSPLRCHHMYRVKLERRNNTGDRIELDIQDHRIKKNLEILKKINHVRNL